MNIVYAVMVPHPPLIVPEVGGGQEKAVEQTMKAYEKAMSQLAKSQPDTVVILTPHSVMYADYFHISPGEKAQGDFSRFRVPHVNFQVAYDSEFVDVLEKNAGTASLLAGTLGEEDPSLDHGTTVPLYYLEKAYEGEIPPKVVRVGLSGLPLTDHYRLGQQIALTARQLNRKVAIVASGDLSHRLTHDGPYGYDPAGPEYDEKIMDTMARGAFGELLEYPSSLCENAAECGHRAFTILAGALDGRNVTSEKLSYQGPFGVGYGVVTFQPTTENKERQFLRLYQENNKTSVSTHREASSPQVELARKTVENYVLGGGRYQPDDALPSELSHKPAGVFVTLYKDDQLRGCIGTIHPLTDSIAEEITANAISAATRDPRFAPVRPDELDFLVYSVDVLGAPEPISSPDQLDPQRYGVIVTQGAKRGLLLPLLEGVDSAEEQVSIALSKAGISPESDYQMERFEVVRYH